MPNKITYTIKTSDGKEHQVSKENIDKHGIQAYADAYKGATIRMRDSKKGDYDIPLANYNDAKAQGLHAFSWEHLPPKAQPQAKQQVAQKQSTQQVATTAPGTPMTATQKAQVLNNISGIVAQSQEAINETILKNKVALDRTKKPFSNINNITLGRKNSGSIGSDKVKEHTIDGKKVYSDDKGNIYDSENSAVSEVQERMIDRDGLSKRIAELSVENENANKRLNEIREKYQKQLTPTQIYGQNGTAGNFNALDKLLENDDEYMMLLTTTRNNQRSLDILRNKQQENNDKHNGVNVFGRSIKSLGRGMRDYFKTDFDPMGDATGKDALAYMRAEKIVETLSKKLQTGETLSTKEKATLALFNSYNQQQDISGDDNLSSWMYSGGRGVSLSAEFGAMIASGAGSFQTIAEKTAQGASKAALSQITKYLGKGVAKNIGTKIATKAVGSVAGMMSSGLAYTSTVGFKKTFANAMQNYVGEMGVTEDGQIAFGEYVKDKEGKVSFKRKDGGITDLVTAFAKAGYEQTKENGTEMLGETLPSITKILKGIGGTAKFVSKLEKIGATPFVESINKALRMTGYNGLPSQGIEEYAGLLSDVIFSDASLKDFGKLQTHLDIWGNVALTSGVMSSVQVAGIGTGAAMFYKYKHQNDKAGKKAQALIGDKWNGIQEVLDNTVNAEFSGALAGILSREDLNGEQKKRVVNYANSLLKMRGFNIGFNNDKMGRMASSGEKGIDGAISEVSYAAGYNATEDELANIKNELELRHRQLAETFKDDPSALQQIEEDPKAFLQGLKESEVGGEKAKVINAYEETRAAYDGMIQRVRDNIDDAITENNTVIEQRTHQDGNIYPATMKLDDRKVYVVGGNVQMNEDGKGIDHEKSSSSVMIRDAETGKIEMVDPSAILSVDTPVNAEEEKATSSEQIRQTYAQEQANKIDGILEFKAGDTYSILGEDQKQHTIQIVGEAIDEKTKQPNPDMVMASIDGLEPTMLPKEQIQAMNDEENLWRLEQSLKQDEDVENTTPHSAQSYNLNDEITLINEDGKPVRGSITTDQNEDGKFEVYTEEPINGKRVNLFTAEELDAMTGKQQEQTNQAPVQEEQGEQMGSPALVAENATTQKEDVSGVNDGTIAENATVQKEETPQHEPTALERIPTNEQGEPIYEQADPETAWDAIVEQTEGDESIAQSVADGMVADMEAAVKRAEKAKVKGGTTIAEKIAAEKERVATIEQAKATLEHWKKIASTNSRRQEAIQAEENRKAKEAALLRKEQEEEERVKRDLAQPQSLDYKLSDEIDENGHPFVLTSAGEVAFGKIGKETGLTPAPILLSEGVITNSKTNAGYGLVHIEARHGEQIRNAGYPSVVAFVEEVAKHYDVIREGINRSGEQTYMLQLTDRHNNTLMVELSGDGTYYNINTAGIFKTSYGKNRREVYNRHATDNQSTESGEESQGEAQSGTTSPSRMKSSTRSSAGKVSESSNALQENVEKSSENEATRVETNPTEAQKEAGNYKKGHIKVDGMNITIEQPKGSIRRGKDASGKEWESEMHNTYGYIRGTEGVDGDHIDIFLSDNPNEGNVFVVDQVNKDGSFDEHKVMYGFADKESARQAYLSNYEDGWQGLGNITEVSKEEFKKWIGSSKRKTKPFAEYKGIIKSNKSVSSPVAMSEDEYLTSKGLNGNMTDYMLDKLRIPHSETARQQKQREKEAARVRADFDNQKEEARKEYRQKIAKGELREPTKQEAKEREIAKLIKTANGHEDNPSVQAARRVLAKRGVDWRTDKGDMSDNDLAYKKELEDFVANTDSNKRTQIDESKYDAEDLFAPLLLDGKSSNLAVMTLISDYIYDPIRQIAVYDYSFDIDNKTNSGWQKWGDLADEYNAHAAEVDKAWGENDNAMLEFRTVDAAVKFNDWLKAKEDGKSNVVHSFGNSASQNDTSIKLSDTSFAKMENGEQKAEREIGWLVDHNIRLEENSRKLDEIAHLLFDGDNIDSNRESTLREEAKKILEENEKLSRDYQKNYSDKYFGTDDITANYILQEANERLIALGVKPVKESYYFQSRKNEVAQNAVVQLLKRIGIPVHVISRVGAEVSGQGNSRGWTNGLDIWLTKDNINAETPVHEYTHIWTFALMKKNPKLWAEIKNLLKDSEWVDKIQSMDEYKYTLDNEDLLYSEVLSRISGERNGEKFESMAFKLIEEVNSVEKKVDLKRGLEKLRDALKRFWEWVGVNLFGMKEFKSVDDVCDRVLFDLLNASDIARTEEMREYYEEEREMNTIIDKAKEDGTYLKTPNGEDTKLPEKVWAYARTKKFKTQLSDRLNLILNESKEDFKDWEKEEFRDLFKKHDLLEENNEPGRFLVSQFMYSEKYYDRKGKMQEEAKETMNVSSVKSVDTRDAEYIKAVENNDTETIQRLLSEEAERKGYSNDSSYQGSLAFNGSAPYQNAYFETKEERKEAWENDEYEDTMSLGDYVDSGIDTNNLEWNLTDPMALRQADPERREAIENLRQTVRSNSKTITIYRAVDANIKENEIRNGDWVTPSRSYAEYHIGLQDWENGRIIEQEVSIDDLWWDGNDIAEWGYDNGKGEVYKNTPNNRKMFEVTYDENGNIIPLSERFNEDNDDIRYRHDDKVENESNSSEDNEAKTFAKQHNLDASDVIAYKQAMEEGLLRDANNALSAIRRKLREENKGLSLSGFVKKFSPIREALYKQFGDLGVLEKEYHDNILKERGLMEAARKREEEERKRQNEPIEELMSMTSEERDAEYMRALEAKDEKRMSEVLQAEAKLKGYSMGSEYQGEGAWKAPSNPGYSSTEERRATIEKDAPHLNIDDIANGYINLPEDIFTDLRAYDNDNESGKESAKAISDAIRDIKDGKEMPKVTVYRAVPTSVEEESLRNGDWVTPSKAYAKEHGEHRLDGDYRIIEQKVPANELWWDGNDIREWGFDNGKDYAYKNTENSRKLNDLITRDDQGNVILPSQRFNDQVEDERFRNDEELEKVNQRFNEELENLTEENADKVTLWLGKPSDVLLSSGIENKPLKLYGNKVIKKMKKHGFALDELRDLPKAVADPIAVFDNLGRFGNRSILTELTTEQGNFLVTIDMGKGEKDVDFNIVSSVFGKGKSKIVSWIERGLATYINKKKALNYLHHSAPIAEALSNSRLSSAANIVKSFENPTNSSEKVLDRKTAQAEEVAEKERQQMVERANELAETLHLDNVEIVTDASTLEGKKAKAKGFYSTSTGKITIVIPNHSNIADVEKTLLHEAVAHHGLRKLFGEHFDNFLDNVFKNASEDVRREIVKLAAKNKWDFRIATEEYLASLAEDTNFEKMPNGLWDKVKRLFLDMLRSIGLLKQKDGELNDNELRYILWRSYKNLKEKGQSNSILNKAEDIAMQHRLKVGNYAPQEEGKAKVSEKPHKTEKVDNNTTLYREDEPEVTARTIYEDAVKDTGKMSMLSALAHTYSKEGRERFKHKFSESYFDYSRSIKQLQDAISKASGRKLEEFEEVWKSLNAKSSIDSEEINLAMLRYISPLSIHIAEMIRGVKIDGQQLTLDDVEVYMNALHGIERNAYMANSELKSLVNKKLEKWKEHRLKKLRDSGISKEEALSVIATEEADKRDEITQLNMGKTRKDYSGLTALFSDENTNNIDVAILEERAQKYVNAFEKAVGKDKVDEMWKKVKNLNDFSIRKAYLSGLINKKHYDEIKNMYEHYVPLRGWHDDYAGDIFEYVNAGQSMDALQGVVKKAYGRTTRAGNILGTMASMANTAIVQGNKNLVAQKFLNLALNYGNKSGLLMVSKQWYEETASGELVPLYPSLKEGMSAAEMQQRIEEFEAEMEEAKKSGTKKIYTRSFGDNMPQNFQKWQEKQHSIRALRNGVEHTIYVLGNPKAAQAFNGLLTPVSQVGAAQDIIMKVMRFQAMMQTSLSPEFVISNFQRDVLTAATGTYIKYGWGAGKDFASNLTKVMPVSGLQEGNPFGIYNLIHKYNKGTLDKTNDIERMFDEFVRKGGMTGISSITRAEEFEKQMEKSVKRIKRGKLDVPQQLWEDLADGIEFMNKGIENATRFAAYMTSRKMGKNVTDSIFDAKECSVNFNMKGSGAWGNLWMRRYILYANPALQSLRMLGTWYEASPKRFMGVFSTVLTASILTAMLGYACGGDDGDDNDWYKLNEFNRYNYISVKAGNGFAHWSLPQEMRPVWALGQIVFDWSNGRVSAPIAINSMATQLNNLSPMAFFSGGSDNDDSFWKTAVKAWTPTVAADFMDAYAWNENFLGKNITYRNDWNKEAPEWRKAGKDTPKWAVNLSRAWNKATGGADNRKSWWDSPALNPSAVYYIMSSQFGGMGTLATKLSRAFEQWQDPEQEVEARNIPFVSKFWVTVGDDYSKNRVLNEEFKSIWNEWKLTDYEIKHNESDLEKGLITDEEYANLEADKKYLANKIRYEALEDLMKDYNTLMRKRNDENDNPLLDEEILELKKEVVERAKMLDK